MAEDSSWHEAPTQDHEVVPQSRKVIIVLENASLEAARLSTRFDTKMQLLNCDEHQSVLKKLGRDIADARPDIVHQVKLNLFLSRKNKKKKKRETNKNALVSLNFTRQSFK